MKNKVGANKFGGEIWGRNLLASINNGNEGILKIISGVSLRSLILHKEAFCGNLSFDIIHEVLSRLER